MLIQILFPIFFSSVFLLLILYEHRQSRKEETAGKGGQTVEGILFGMRFALPFFSAVLFIGLAGTFGVQFGIYALILAAVVLVIGYLFGFWVLLPRIQKLSLREKERNIPAFLSVRTGSNALKPISAGILLCSALPLLAATLSGMAELLFVIFPETDYSLWISVFSIVSFVLFLFGATGKSRAGWGVTAVLTAVCIFAATVAVLTRVGGFSALLTAQNEAESGFFLPNGENVPSLLSAFLLLSLSVWILPGTFSFACQNSDKKVLKITGGVSFGLILIAILGSGIPAVLAPFFLQKEQIGADSAIPQIIASQHPIVIGIFLLAVFSASAVLISGIVETVGSCVMTGIFATKKGETASKARPFFLKLPFALLFFLLSAQISYFKDALSVSTSDLTGWSLCILCGCLLVPYLYGIFLKAPSKAAAYLCIGIGFVVSATVITKALFGLHFGVSFINTLFSSPYTAAAFAVGLNFILFPIVNGILKKKTATDE